jgi:hypothetical protein
MHFEIRVTPAQLSLGIAPPGSTAGPGAQAEGRTCEAWNVGEAELFDGAQHLDGAELFGGAEHLDGAEFFDGAETFDGAEFFDGAQHVDGAELFDAAEYFDGGESEDEASLAIYGGRTSGWKAEGMS